jgi:hypothetical protein
MSQPNRIVLGLTLAASLVAAGEARGAGSDDHLDQLALRATPAVVKVWNGWIVDFQVGALGISGKYHWVAWGSGFFISPDGYLVTNAHVVEGTYEGEDKARAAAFKDFVQALWRDQHLDQQPQARQQEIFDSIRIGDMTPLTDVQLTDGSHLAYTVEAFGTTDQHVGKDVAVIKVATQNAPTLAIEGSAVHLGQHLYAIGFPGAGDFAFTGSDDGDTKPIIASLTDGRVSAVDKRAASGVPVIQVSIPISHGNSGGPVLDEDGKVVGLATWGSEAQGFNFLVAASAVMEQVRKSGAPPHADNDTDRVYREGLDQLAAGNLDAAIRSFEEVKELFPSHPEVGHLLEDARKQQREGRGSAGGSGGATGPIVGLLLAAAAITGLVVYQRRRRSGPAVPALAYAPSAPTPSFVRRMFDAARHPLQTWHGRPPGAPMTTLHGVTPARAASPPAPSVSPARTLAIAPSGPGSTLAISPGNLLSQLVCGSLVCVRGPLAGRRFDIPATGLVIGREAGVAQIVIPDARASSRHVSIVVEAGRTVVVDPGSTNGTFLNDPARGRVDRRELADGDHIIVADPDVGTFVYHRAQASN